jgi:hypothetical protein
MANLKVSIVIRTSDATGRRGWAKATGKKSDPAGPLYIRWYEGSSQRNDAVKGCYEEAEMAQLRKRNELRAASIGAVIPGAVDSKTSRHWRNALASFIDHLNSKTKRNGWPYDARSVRSREKNI